MTMFEVGYESDGFISVNLIDTEDRESAKAYAESHAQKHGYNLLYVNYVADWYAKEHIAKGMPVKKL